jgi:hypothetical protein
MNSGTGNEFQAEHHDRLRKIRKAAAIALKELNQLRSGGPMTQKALDAEVARIAREKLQPYGCDLAVLRMAGGLTRFLIEVQSTGKRYDLIKSFFRRDDELIPEEGLT